MYVNCCCSTLIYCPLCVLGKTLWYGHPVLMSKGRHKKKLQYGTPLLLGKGRHKKGYSIVVLPWVREHTKGIYSMVILSC